MEEIIINLISCGGEAKSFSMEAISYAKEGEFEKAKEALKSAEESLTKAHVQQTKLIQSEAQNNKIEVSLLMVHAQDHLMNAITVKDMAEEFIDLYEKIYLK
ncbi:MULTISPECIES: PTS lactose/cellobiose transporter subunit IIA [Clostridium]|uniref:PTS lactose/cellobiose transporter subunit IIA n=1 Tax=Clostridium senegalense TaxID=1465809 RepID=UPI0002897204|nr:PTS lactose/cellobiose transporter subunit IIA [Clostridium senegalense]